MGWLTLLMAALLQALSLSGWSSGWASSLQCASLSVLMAHAIRAPDSRAVILATGWFSVVWLFLSFSWIHTSLHEHGGMPWLMAWAAVGLLAVGLGTYHALAMGLAHWLTRNASTVWRLLALVCAWSIAELARSTWFTGFPWASPGYAHVDGLLGPLASDIGVMGINVVSAGLAAALAWARMPYQLSFMKRWGSHAVLLLGLAWAPTQTSLGDPRLEQTVALLQANVNPKNKFMDGGQAEWQWYLQQLQTNSSDLMLAPETAWAQVGDRAAFQESLQSAGAPAQPHQAIIVGAMEAMTGGYANAAWGLMQNQVHAYHKQHLVPFGEYTPPWFNWIAQWLSIPYSDFKVNPAANAVMVHRQHVYAVGICYEDLFGEEMAQRFVGDQARPTTLVNLSNLAWFGSGRALDQHLAIGRMRAMEFRRPMLMATNTGWSAVIDDTGQILGRLPKSQRASLNLSYRGVDAPPTRYASWAGQWGHTPLWLASLLGLGLAAWAGMRSHWRKKSQLS